MSTEVSWSNIFKNIEDNPSESYEIDEDIENDIQLDNIDNKTEENKQIQKQIKCLNCNNLEIEEIETVYYCKNCGIELDIPSTVEDTNASTFSEHNFNSACSIGFKVVGKKCYSYNKNMLCVSADSSKQSFNIVTKEFQVIINNCLIILPKNVIDESIQLFFDI